MVKSEADWYVTDWAVLQVRPQSVAGVSYASVVKLRSRQLVRLAGRRHGVAGEALLVLFLACTSSWACGCALPLMIVPPSHTHGMGRTVRQRCIGSASLA
jgi:hypothetical protein